MIAGLTGGIGSGKSTVARLFQVLGCAVFMSDEAAKAAYHQQEVREKIEQLIGKEAYSSATEINRKYISSKVFGDRGLLQQVNAIIHPAVGVMFREFVKLNPNKVIIKESALLFEAGVTSGLDKIIVVAAPDEKRIERVMKRDGSTREQVVARLQTQLSQEEKVKRADFVVHNDGQQLIIPQVNRIFTRLQAHDQERLPGKTA